MNTFQNGINPIIDFRLSLESGVRSSPKSSGEERGLPSLTAAGNRACINPGKGMKVFCFFLSVRFKPQPLYKSCEKCSPVFPVGFLVIDILYQFAVSGRQSLVFTLQFIILALKHAAFLTSRVKREKTSIKRQENDASTIFFR